MTTGEASLGRGPAARQYLSPWLWVGAAGAVLQLMGLGSDFYSVPKQGAVPGWTSRVPGWASRTRQISS